jgi:predicted GNAT family acetyltransferase
MSAADDRPGGSPVAGNPVSDSTARSRFELALADGVAFIDYRRDGKRHLLLHAEVPPALRGRGIAAQLTAGALQLVRAQGGSVEARCSYVAQFIAHNAQYQDLLARS